MSRLRCLELFAGGQGSAVGYARAGLEVHAVDVNPHDKHPEIESFTQANAFDVLADVEFCRTFDLITGGPPCKDHTDLATLAEREHSTGWMLPTMILWCQKIGRPWVVENVESAAPIQGSLMLCGTMFDDCWAIGDDGVARDLRRHRLFASSEFIAPPGPCRHRGPGTTLGVYGTGGGGQMNRGYKARPDEAKEAMGIDWMTRAELSQAIPPNYTQWIGERLMKDLRR
jgi:DNA (cytosine-5)-methyltransferase 1